MAIAVTNSTLKARWVGYKHNGQTQRIWLKAHETKVIDLEIDHTSLVDRQSKLKNTIYKKNGDVNSLTKNLIKNRGGFSFDESNETNQWGGQIAIIDNRTSGEYDSITFERIAKPSKELYFTTGDDVSALGTNIYTYPRNDFPHRSSETLKYTRSKLQNEDGGIVHKSSSQFNNILPNEMGIVINSDDTTSVALAAQYQAAWNIPSANVVTVSLGSFHDLANIGTQALNTARALISSNMPSTVQWLALCFEKPSRLGDNSITWAITMGHHNIDRNVEPLPSNPMYNWDGSHPYDVLGIRPSMLVYKSNVATNGLAAHATGPVGTCYMHMAMDTASASRGTGRVNQMTTLSNNTDYSPQVTMSLTHNLGGGIGENAANNILNKPDMLFYFNGMYKIYDHSSNTIVPGCIGDHRTSYAGYLPTPLDSQTPATMHLDAGFVATIGMVAEPWQNAFNSYNWPPNLQALYGAGPYYGEGAGDIPDQMSDLTILVPKYIEGDSTIAAYWRGMKQPPRTLVMGDPMCSPFANVTGSTTGSTAISGATGCTIPYALNYDTDATILGTNCAFNRWAYRMDDVLTTPAHIEHFATGGGFWGPDDIDQGTPWRRASFSTLDYGGGDIRHMIVNDYNTVYPFNQYGIIAVDFHDLTVSGNSYQWINSHLQVQVDTSTGTTGDTKIVYVSPTPFVDPDVGGLTTQYQVASINKNSRYESIRFVFPIRTQLSTLIGGAGSNSNACPMSLSMMGAILDIPQADQFPVAPITPA